MASPNFRIIEFRPSQRANDIQKADWLTTPPNTAIVPSRRQLSHDNERRVIAQGKAVERSERVIDDLPRCLAAREAENVAQAQQCRTWIPSRVASVIPSVCTTGTSPSSSLSLCGRSDRRSAP